MTGKEITVKHDYERARWRAIRELETTSAEFVKIMCVKYDVIMTMNYFGEIREEKWM